LYQTAIPDLGQKNQTTKQTTPQTIHPNLNNYTSLNIVKYAFTHYLCHSIDEVHLTHARNPAGRAYY
jgi:hypothetical protein